MTASIADRGRPYEIADAILSWLYHKLREGSAMPAFNLASVMEVAHWQGDPITQQEWDQATNYLRDRGLIDGQGTWGGGIPRPKLTVAGQDLVATGQSCRPQAPAPQGPAGSTTNLTINNNGPAQVAINSSDFTQTLNVGTSDEKLATLAELLERYSSTNPDNGDEVAAVAAEVREVAAAPQDSRGPVAALLARVISAVALVASTEVGQQITTLAVDLMQSLPA